MKNRIIKLCIVIGLILISFQSINAQNIPVIYNSHPIEGEKHFTAEVYQLMLKDEQILNEMKAIGNSALHENQVSWLVTLSDHHIQWIRENKEKAKFYGVGSGDVESTPFNAYRSEMWVDNWRDHGGPYWHTASSELSENHSIENLKDNDIRTAWVEGKKGDGIGESITYRFLNDSPRVTEIIIFNGYAKSDGIWQANNRVKELEVLINNKPYTTLSLDDTWQEQVFEMPNSLGQFKSNYLTEHDPANDNKLTKYWTLTLRIVSVYPGTKYKDTAISEIFFNGIDAQ